MTSSCVTARHAALAALVGESDADCASAHRRIRQRRSGKADDRGRRAAVQHLLRLKDKGGGLDILRASLPHQSSLWLPLVSKQESVHDDGHLMLRALNSPQPLGCKMERVYIKAFLFLCV